LTHAPLQATFKHLTDNPFRLRLPEFSCEPGELVAVVGRVGAGKSSILQAVMGNMTLEAGEAHAAGEMAYVPQVAWCQNLSLRENIVFGQPWEEDRYRQVIHACALELDLQILAAGDQSKVRAGLLLLLLCKMAQLAVLVPAQPLPGRCTLLCLCGVHLLC
jgi:ABC-type transport system involved in cytochrome bd biosynthesis fused ATPase/permease subunit